MAEQSTGAAGSLRHQRDEGVPHLSVADGWWWEAYSGSNGWRIDSGPEKNDAAEADSLYRLLEEKIAPAFYARDEKGIPKQWLQIAREAIREYRNFDV